MKFKKLILLISATFLFTFVSGCSSQKHIAALQAKYPPFIHPSQMMIMAGPEGGAVSMGSVVQKNGVAHRLYSQPDKNDEAPMVVILGGSEGGIPNHNSRVAEAILARGYSMAGIGYHKAFGTPEKLREIAIEPIIERIESLSVNENGDKRCLAIIGVSKGAELALLIGANSNVADAYVATVPSNVVWQASEVSLRSRSSWTLNGEPLAFVKYPWFSKGTLTFFTEGVTKARGIHEAGLERTQSLAAVAIPVEKISSPVLLQASKQDDLWPSYEMSSAIMKRLEAKNVEHNFSLESYELDHYLLLNQQPVDDAIAFINRAFDNNPNCNL